jgi:hypothetical protein
MHVSEQLHANTRILTVNGSGADWQAWPSAAQVKTRLEITQAQLNALITSGRVVRWQCPDGKLRFDPSDVDELSDEMGADAEKRETAQASKEKNDELATVLSRAVSLLKIAQEHTEKLFSISTGPIQRGTDFLLRINDQQASRIEYLEKQHGEMFIAREALLSQQQERDLKARRVELGSQNVKHAIDQVTDALGPIAHQILGNLGLKIGKAHPGLELLQSIDPALLMSLVQLNLLSPQQLKLCREIWPDLEWPDPPPPESKAAPEEPVTSSGPNVEHGPAQASPVGGSNNTAPPAAASAPKAPPPSNHRAPRRRRTQKGSAST